MKLRNRKTGEIVDVESLGHANSLKEKFGYQVTLSWKTEYENLSQCKDYDSLAELNEEWEDAPAEPLIKNEKVRKAVRAWADAVGTDEAYLELENEEPSTFYVYKFAINCHYIQIAFHDKNPIEGDRLYTIDELCGEVEELHGDDEN